MRRYFPLVLLMVLLCGSSAQAIPYLQAAGPLVVVSNAGQAADLLDRVLWREGDDISDPAPDWREPGFADGGWVAARPAWRSEGWNVEGPLDGPTGPDHIWFSEAGALADDVGNGIPFPTRYDGTDYDNGYSSPDILGVLFLRKNFCLPLNAVPRSPETGQLEILGVEQYVAWMNGNNQVGVGGGTWPPAQDTHPIYSSIVPLYAGHNTMAVRSRTLQGGPAALIYRLTVDYDLDPQVITILGPADVIVGQPFTLDAQVTGNPGDPPYAYSWDLGDSNVASGASIVHTYASTGTFAVLLTVADSYPCTGTATLPITVHAQPPLSIAKTDNPDPVVEGGMLDYNLTVHNGGTVDLGDVAVTDTIPLGTTFVACSPNPCGEVEGAVSWTGLTIPAGGDASISFRVQVGTGLTLIVNDGYSAGAAGAVPARGAAITTTVVQPTMTPTPTATSTPGPTDTPVPATATATPTEPAPTATVPPPTVPTSPPGPPPTAVPGAARLILSHDVLPTTASPGEEVVYLTVVTNTGTAAAPNVVLKVPVPEDLEPGQVTLPPAYGDITSWTGSTLWVAWGTLGPGASVSLTLSATVHADAAAGEAVSVARVEDYGLEDPAVLLILLPVLPAAGVSTQLWWGLPLLAGVLVLAGLLLRLGRKKN